MSKINLPPLASGYRSSNRLNENFDKIREALENTVSRDGSVPNQMEAALDMNSNRVVNVGAPIEPNDAVRLVDLEGVTGGSGAALDAEAIRDILAATLVAGTNVEIVENDGADTIVISATGGATLDTEAVRDIIGTTLLAGSNVNIIVDDVANTVSVSCTMDQEVIRDTVASFIVAGSNVTVVHDDAANTFTISAVGAGGGLTAEDVRDTIGAALVAGAGISITVNDAGDTITITATGSGAVDPNVATLTALRAATWPSGRPLQAMIISNWVTGDGGGLFRWSASSTATDNGGTIIKETATATGRWLRQYTGPVDGRWFNCVGDNSTYNDTAFNAIMGLGSGTKLYLPAGNYKTSIQAIDLTFHVDGEGTIICDDGNRLASKFRRIQTPASRGSTNSNLFDGDNSYVDDEFWIMDASPNGLTQPYFDKTITPKYQWIDFRNRGSSGMRAAFASTVVAGATSALLNSVAGLAISMRVGFGGDGGSVLEDRVITNIIGNTIYWSGGLANSYSAGAFVTDSLRTHNSFNMIAGTARSLGDNFCQDYRLTSAPIEPITAGQPHCWNYQTIAMWGGDLTFTGNYAYGTVYEAHLNEAAGSVGNMGIFAVESMSRRSSDTSKGAQWGFRLCLSDSVEVDWGLSLVGNIKSGIDTTMMLSTQSRAVSIKKGYRIYWNCTPGAVGGVELYGLNAGTTWTGMRTSDNAFETYLEGNVVHEIFPSGDVCTPRAMSIVARKSSTSTGATGDGTLVTLVYDTELTDQNARYNNTTGIATVTADGTYDVMGAVYLATIAANHTSADIVVIMGSNSFLLHHNPFALKTGTNVVTIPYHTRCKMTAGQTIEVKLSVSGGSKIVDILGSSNMENFLSIVKVA